MTNIAVFASGTGSNAVNIVKSFNGGSRIHVALCLTDKEDAPVVQKMKDMGIETQYFPRSVWRENPDVILETLRSHDISLIALAGFLCFVDDRIVTAYEGRILNIHPSLLPAYGGKGMHGKKVHQAVIEAGEPKSGATVHVVTDTIDMGPIVMQKEVPVLPGDTAESLEARVHEAEYELYPNAIAKVVKSIGKNAEVSGEEAQGAVNAEPPAVPRSVDDAWAEALGVSNNVPPVPQSAPQPAPQYSQQYSRQPQPGGYQQFGYQPWPPTGSPAPAGVRQSALQTAEPMPPTWLVWSIVITILCCFIPGLVAIIYSSKVSSKYFAGDIEGAKRSSRMAEIWIIISFVLGVVSNTLYIPLSIAGLF